LSPRFEYLRRELAARDAERRSLCNAAVEPESVLLPFGKHRGRSLGWIAENDLRYLDWLIDAEIRSLSLKSAIEATWKMHEREIANLVGEED
jgi:hypothetical protein